jgi:3-oxoadipate enol-lactonase
MGSTWRPGAGASLVLLNSIGSDQRAWQWLGLDDTVPLTYPGHGERPRQPGWSHEDMADEVVAAADGPLDLLGVALGGMIALQILVRHPHRVRSAIVVCGGSVRGSEERAQAIREVSTSRGRLALQGGMSAVVDDTIERWFTPFAIRTHHPGVEYARKTLADMDPASWNDAWLSLANASLISTEDARRITAPVTLVGGMHDRSAGLDGLAGLHRLIPRSRFEILAAPHMIHLEQPEDLRTSIERHYAWMRTGNRVEQPISSPGWPNLGVTQGGGG